MLYHRTRKLTLLEKNSGFFFSKNRICTFTASPNGSEGARAAWSWHKRKKQQEGEGWGGQHKAGAAPQDGGSQQATLLSWECQAKQEGDGCAEEHVPLAGQLMP